MQSEKAGIREKFSYGFCASAYEIEVAFTLSYFTLFCTDVMKINVGVLSTVFLVTKIIDALTDLIITNLADKTHTRFGTYRPYLLGMGVPLGITVMLIYSAPSFLTTDTVKWIWLIGLYILLCPVFETGTICPVMVMGTIMSSDYHDRLDFAASRGIGENLSDIFVNATAMTLILVIGGSYKNPLGWRCAGLIYGAMIICSALIGFFGTRERVPVSNCDSSGQTLSLSTKLKALLFGNKPYMKLLGFEAAYILQWNVTIILFSYFCIYNIGHEEWVASLSTIGILVQLAVTALLPKLGRKYTKRSIMMVGLVLVIISSFCFIGAHSYTGLLAYQVIRGLGNGFTMSLLYSLWPEASDYTEKIKGIAIPGIVLAMGTFTMKVAGGLGNFFATQLLNLSGYNEALAVQNAATLSAIRYGTGGIAIAGCAIALVLAWSLREYTPKN